MDILFSDTFRKAEAQATKYNQDKKLCEAIRPEQLQTFYTIVKLFALEIGKCKKSGLPIRNRITTNRGQLATMRRLCRRTIDRHLTRLVNAGYIATKGRYFIQINPNFVAISGDVLVKMQVLEFEYIVPTKATSLQGSEKRTSNKKLISNAINSLQSLNELPTLHGKIKKEPHEPLNGNIRKQSQNKAAKIYGNRANLKSNNGAEKHGAGSVALLSLVKFLVNYVVNNLYQRIDYLTIEQVKIISDYFYISLKSSKNFNSEFYSHFGRLGIIRSWLEKKPDRYIPLPSKYFNSTGRGTYEYSKTFISDMAQTTEQAQALKVKFKRESLIYKHLQRSFQSLLKDKSIANYTKHKKFLGKISPEAENAYNELIINN